MAETTRWMSWVLDESATTTDTVMPWSNKARTAATPKFTTPDRAAKTPALKCTSLKSA